MQKTHVKMSEETTLFDDIPVDDAAYPVCSSSDKIKPTSSKTTSVRGKRRSPGAKVISQDAFPSTRVKTTKKTKQVIAEDNNNDDYHHISIDPPSYSSSSSSVLSDDLDQLSQNIVALSSSETPLLQQSPLIYKYDTMDPNSFIEMDYTVWCKMKKNFEDICIHINSERNMIVDLRNKYNVDKQPLKAFGQYIMILNYNGKDPIILGVNESIFEGANDGKILNAYVIKNTCKTNGSKNVHMVIVTTEQKYAQILFEKFIKSEQVPFRNLKNRDMWCSPETPLQIL